MLDYSVYAEVIFYSCECKLGFSLFLPVSLVPSLMHARLCTAFALKSCSTPVSASLAFLVLFTRQTRSFFDACSIDYVQRLR